MSKRPRPRARRATRHISRTDRVSAAEFKATCLELMDRVRETGMEYVVTKHGKPVAKLVPHSGSDRNALFGAMKDTLLKYERPFDPIDGDSDIDHA